jgi:hypothetical protein
MLDDPIVYAKFRRMAPTVRRLLYSGKQRWHVDFESAKQAVTTAVNELLYEGMLGDIDPLELLEGIKHSDLSADFLRRFLSLLTKYFRLEQRLTLKGRYERSHLCLTESSAITDGENPFEYSMSLEKAIARVPPLMQQVVGYLMYRMPTARAIKRDFGLRRREWDALLVATPARLKTELYLIEQEQLTMIRQRPERESTENENSTIESASGEVVRKGELSS